MKCFHHNDLDGKCAGFIVSEFTGNKNPDDYYEVDYVMDLNPYLENIKQGEQVWFVDYSFTEKTKTTLTYLMFIKDCEVIWIDHHTSSINLVKSSDTFASVEGLRSEKYSGAYLTYVYCYDKDMSKEENIPYYIRLVDDYDCWKFKLEDTTYFKLGMDTKNHGVLDDVWKRLSNSSLHPTELLDIIRDGSTIKKYIDMDNTQYRDSYSYESEIGGYKCLVVNRKSNSWIFGEKYNEYPLVAVWAFDGTIYSYSLYSGDKNVDCSKIAESYGGGGHTSASGFTTKELILKKV